jgi:hypothetical protein
MNYELPAVRGSKLSIGRGGHVDRINRGRALFLSFSFKSGGLLRFPL